MSGALRRRTHLTEINSSLLGLETEVNEGADTPANAPFYRAAVASIRHFMVGGWRNGEAPPLLAICTFAQSKLFPIASTAADLALRRDILRMIDDPPATRAAARDSVAPRGRASSAGSSKRAREEDFDGTCNGCGRYGHRLRDCPHDGARGARGTKRGPPRAFGAAPPQPFSYGGGYSYPPPMQPMFYAPPAQPPQQ